MQKNHLFAALFVFLSAALISFSKPSVHPDTKAAASGAFVKETIKTTIESAVTSLSTSLNTDLHLNELGLSKEALEDAVKGYQKLVAEGAVSNARYLTIVDMSQSSRKKRFYLLDVANHQLVVNTFVSHGKNSGVDIAEHFSNEPNSEETSLGFYITGATYTGKHGISLRLTGMEEGFNDNAQKRGVVVHGAPYVNDQRVNSDYMGRSQGCPALPENVFSKVINIIKDGSVLFIYHPTEEYLQQSQLLNS